MHPNSYVYISDAFLVDCARPGVQAAPGLPFHSRGAWVLILTIMLPNSGGSTGRGNGRYRIHAIATELPGKSRELGARKITVPNAMATKPFRAIDTPLPGGTSRDRRIWLDYGWGADAQPFRAPFRRLDDVGLYRWGSGSASTFNLFRADVASLSPAFPNANGALGSLFDRYDRVLEWAAFHRVERD